MSPQRENESPGDLLRELEALRRSDSKEGRSEQAWRIVTRAYGSEGWYAIVDFALENGLVEPYPVEASKKQTVQETLPPQTWINPRDGAEMIWIPPGPFVIGLENLPARSQGFSLARHPVTNGQFQRFLEESGYRPSPEHPDPNLFLSHWKGGAVPKNLVEHPVVWVSFVDALAYCRWAGGTLPTEWLWEKAARGSDGRPVPWGTQPPIRLRPFTRLAQVATDGTCPVGSFPRTRSAYGCEDLIGNVSEWCQMTEPDTDPGQIPLSWPQILPPEHLPHQNTAVRGSCFLRRVPKRMRAWHRRQLWVYRRNRWVGFRVACFLPCLPGP
jgi:serine/threonine-protein kinase